MDSLARDLEALDVTKDELKRITDSLKSEQFRSLLADYAKEVNDPENRRLYEQEMQQLERQRGVDLTFVKPQPGYVLKTSANGERKCFVNVSQSELVDRPTSEPERERNRGLKWSIPFTLTPPRDDLDHSHTRCVVVDVIFHPDTLHLASKNAPFRNMVNNIAVDAVEQHFKIKLDRKNLKFPKLSYKGNYQPSVIRKPIEKPEPCDEASEIDSEIYQKLMSDYDESRECQSKLYTVEKPQRPNPVTKYFNDQDCNVEEDEGYTKPNHTIKYQTDVDLEDYTNDKDAKLLATVPKRLLIMVDLPLLRSAEDATLDVKDQLLTLKSERPAKYYLKLPLPYLVDADNGDAKFDAKHKKLNVTLPVIRKQTYMEDSGVDSDNGSPVHETIEDLMLISKSPLSSDNVNTVTSDEVNNDQVRLVDKETNFNSVSIMDPNIKYILPMFICNIFENILAITINVKNVEADSISRRILHGNSGVHIVCKTIGSGFFPCYYSLCFKIRENIVDPESLVVETWDNNVVITVTLRNVDNLSHYTVGLDENFMEMKYFSNIETVKKKLESLMQEPAEETNKNVQVQEEENSIIIKINSSLTDSEDEDQPEETQSHQQDRKRSLIKSRSISESSGDELPSNSGRFKSILKSRREFSRSVSESSIDDGIISAPSIPCSYDSAQEINSESECVNLKKTVRFNEVVSRQLYRSNSSILGQRRKNQRKVRNKKRAYERRMSESENSETEERDKYRVQAKPQEY